jgi:hypothetical protein
LRRGLPCPGRAATLLRCCAEPGPRWCHGTLLRDGPRLCSAPPKSAALRPGHERGSRSVPLQFQTAGTTLAVSRRCPPEFCFSLHTLSKERARGRPGAGWHPQDPRAKTFAHAMHRRDTGQPRHPAFPAQWFDGLCRAFPETSSFMPPSPRELTMQFARQGSLHLPPTRMHMRYAVRDEPCMTRLTTMAAMPASTAFACGDASMSMIGFDGWACS